MGPAHYLLRGFEIDAPHGNDCAFVFTKMGRFALFGIIEPMDMKWRGTRVGVRAGRIKPSRITLPPALLNYLQERARQTADLEDAIPMHQADEIEAELIKKPDHVVATDQFAAILADERMFGTDAILRKNKADGS